MSRKKAVLLLIIGMVVLIGIISLVLLLTQKDTNQFGKFIRIQNYGQKVKNLSPDMRDAMESYLYNVTKRNVDNSVDPGKVSDAMIRDSSDTQNYDQPKGVYSGNFIVDMASIKQSYYVQYSYSQNNTVDVGGNPVVVSCLPKEKLIYGEFKCTDLVSSQSNSNDILLQYLPYENFSFKLTPDATQEGKELVIIATLTIPQSDLSGDAASKAYVVSMYKKQVTNWITSKGADPSKFIIQYNYNDDGTPVPQPSKHGD